MVGASNTATLFLFHETAQRSSVPDTCRLAANVQVEEFRDGGIAALHARRIMEATAERPQGSNIEIQQKLARLFYVTPASLSEFKPSWGWVFGEYLDEYSHWTYTDMDVIFGQFFLCRRQSFFVTLCNVAYTFERIWHRDRLGCATS